jgi:hypothetical protein
VRRPEIAGGVLAAALVGLALVPAGARGQAAGGDLCLTDPVVPPTRDAQPVRFGVTPDAAGSAGVAQQTPVPFDEARGDQELLALRPPGRELVVRLNRLFEADGDAGIARFAAKVDRLAALGLRSEVQVRYHPGRGEEGDMAAWEDFVRRAAAALGRRRALVALSITNEANLPLSPNTSDGSFAGAREAIVRGILAGRAALDALGRADVPVGFTVAWRSAPNADRDFFRELGARGGRAFAAALGYVGVQLYPGLFWPPVKRPGVTAGDEVAEALALLRTCLMPQAGLGDRVALWVTEIGYATNLARDERSQVDDLRSTVSTVHDVSGTLGVTDLRWFNLRDNDSDGTDLFSAVGLLRDTYGRKPSFDALRDGIAAVGAAAPAVAVKPAAPAPTRRQRAQARARQRAQARARARARARACRRARPCRHHWHAR